MSIVSCTKSWTIQLSLSSDEYAFRARRPIRSPGRVGRTFMLNTRKRNKTKLPGIITLPFFNSLQPALSAIVA